MESLRNTNWWAITRTGMMVVAIGLQVLFAWLLSRWLLQYTAVIYLALEVISVMVAIMLMGRHENPAYKTAWTMIVLLMPVMGLLLYAMWGRGAMGNRERHNISAAFENGDKYMQQDPAVMADFLHSHADRERMAKKLLFGRFPLYRGTAPEYFPVGEKQFLRMFEDMENAKKFIFMEYFIVGDGQILDRTYNILARKAGQGLDVRLMFDDLGSMFTFSPEMRRKFEEAGIKLQRFNPVLRYVANFYLNFRMHQKIVIIDGDIGYTGGTNLSDEYANLVDKHGHWKDTAIRLSGDAVKSLTVFFLQIWDTATHSITQDYTPYFPTQSREGVGFFQPFSDGPFNNPINPGEDSYQEIINSSRHYLYLTTPYLVLDYSMVDSLCRAAASGVDVRIVMPSNTDHWYVFIVSRSFYEPLLKAGVRIYEYVPGFIHAKMAVSDGDQAIIGTINMDYRSFYLQYEDSMWICGDPVVGEIKQDVLEILSRSREVTEEEWSKRPFYTRWVSKVFNLFAPLM